MIKFMLNLHKFNNYAFFCPVSRLHLTVSSPVGFANEVTPAILRGLKTKAVLDVDGVIDLETGTVKEAKAQTTPEPEKTEDKIEAPAEPKVEAPAEPEAPTEPEAPAEPAKEEAEQKEEKQDKKTSNKRGKRAEAAPVDEAK